MDELKNDVKHEVVSGLIREPHWLKVIREEWVSPDRNDPDRALVSIMMQLDKQGIVPSAVVMHDMFRNAGNSALEERFDECMLIETDRTVEYIIDYLRSTYNELALLDIYNTSIRMLGTNTASEVVEWETAEKKARIVHTIGRRKNNASATPAVFEKLGRMYTSKKRATYYSGWNKIDDNIPLAPKNIVLWAAKEKVGKSRFVRALCKRLMSHQAHLRLKWFHFEMSIDEVFALDISYLTGISTDVIKGYSRLPSDQEFDQIMHTREMLEGLPIEHYGQIMDIHEIRREVEHDADENTIVVIDNLGLIRRLTTVGEGNPHDDMVAAELKEMRDETGALIMPIHHLTKATEHYSNKANGYAPAFKDLRGSNRIIDYANTAVLLHRFSLYTDLEGPMSAKWKDLQNQVAFRVKGRDVSGEQVFVMGHRLECCKFFDETTDVPKA